MTWSRRLIWCGAFIALLLVVGACGPKDAPAVPADAVTPSTPSKPADKPATDVTAPPRTSTDDQTQNVLPREITEADKVAREKGLIGDIYFDFDKYDLKPEARERLSKNAEFMKLY